MFFKVTEAFKVLNLLSAACEQTIKKNCPPFIKGCRMPILVLNINNFEKFNNKNNSNINN